MFMVQGAGEVTSVVEKRAWSWQRLENMSHGHRAADIVSTVTKGQGDSHHLGLFLSKATQLGLCGGHCSWDTALSHISLEKVEVK